MATGLLANWLVRLQGVRLTQFQYRSELAISGSSDASDIACWPQRWANSSGVNHCNAVWGRASLEYLRQASILRLASSSDNQCAFRLSGALGRKLASQEEIIEDDEIFVA